MSASQMSFGMLLIFVASTVACTKTESPVPVKPAESFMQLAPSNGSSMVAVTPTFSWEASVNAVAYSILVSTKNDYSNPVVDSVGIKENQLIVNTALSAGTRYFWKVTAVNDAGSIEATNAGTTFRTLATPPVPSPGISKYYISPAGEDNPDKGTFSEPFKTLAYAASRVPASENDTLYLLPGTYIETEPSVIPVGVNVIGAGEGTTILSSTGVSLPTGIDPKAANFKLWYDGALIQLVSPHRKVFRNNSSAVLAPANGSQIISGFTIDGNNKSLKAGVWVENRNNVAITHIIFKDLAQRGAVVAPGDKDFYVYPVYYLEGIKINDCSFINSGKDLSDETLGNLCMAQLDGAIIHNITVQDNQGYGIKFIYDGYFKNCKIFDCTIMVNESDQKWGEDISIELWNVGPGNEIYNITCNTWLSIVNHPEMFGTPSGTENMKIHSVTMIDKDGVSSKEAIEVGAPGIEVYNSYFENKGIGMALWDMGRGNIIIHNNVFRNSVVKTNWASGAAIYIDNSRTWEFKNIGVYNNVFDTHDVAVKIKGDNVHDVNIKNNVFLNTKTSDIDATGTNIAATNNLKYKQEPFEWIFSGVTNASDNLMGNPGFMNTGLFYDTYYKPATLSSLVVDKGVDVGISFSRNAPDIGAYEFK